MATIPSYSDHAGLRRIINESYGVDVDGIALHRDVIGRVYIASGRTGRYVLKIYRPHHTEDALQSVHIMNYLGEAGYPVAPVVPSVSRRLNLSVDTPDGRSVAVLYEHVEGREPDLGTEVTRIGRQVRRLHEVMKSYPHPLLQRDKSFYVDRFTSMMRAVGYCRARIEDLEGLGDRLWRRMGPLPRGFCHGDLHTGNMIQMRDGECALLDFDAAAGTWPAIDVATLCDCTDFFDLREMAYDSTMDRLEGFWRGYGSRAGRDEVDGILAFIAIRHYEIIATILGCEGLENLSHSYLDKQYEWLFHWEQICQERGWLS